MASRSDSSTADEGAGAPRGPWEHQHGVASDVRLIVSHALRNPTLGRYSHYLPRTPSAVKDHVMEMEEVRHTIRLLSEEQGVTETSLRKEAVDILDKMGHTMSTASIVFTAYAVRKIVNSLYERVIVNKEDLQKIALLAKDKPVILLPTHRSYMDFIVLSYVFLCGDVPVPIIAAGEDFQKMAVVGKLLQGCGAFYMRRSFAGDRLYWSLFSSYVATILTNGDAPVEFFIEGTRSRTGKSLHPKLGLLSAATAPFFSRKVADMAIVPVSISFNERLETSLYVEEMLGKPKPKESFSALLKARSVLNHNHGHLTVNFAPPLSLREYAQGRVDRKKHAARPGPHVTTHEERALVEDLAYEVISKLERGMVIMLPSILATLILVQSYSNASESEIAKRRFTVDPAGVSRETVQRALQTLEPAVSLENNVVRVHLSDFHEKQHDFFNAVHLAHFRNEVLHVFLPEVIALLAIHEASLATLSLEKEHEFIYKLLSKEFPLRNMHGKSLPYFERGLDALIAFGVLDPRGVGKGDVHNTKMTRFQLSLLRPFLHASVLTLETIKRMNEENEFPVIENTILKAVQAVIEGSAFNTSQPECMSASVISNCIRSFASAGVLVKKLIDEKEKTVGLEVSHAYNNKQHFKDLLQHLSQLTRHTTQPFNTSALRRFISPHM